MRTTRLILTLFILLSAMAIMVPAIHPPAHATDGTSYYDFIAHASEASWSSGDGSLSFPGNDSDSRGFTLYKEDVELEDGIAYDQVLETHPNWDAYGHIQGTYPEMTVIADTELVICVGFLEGAAGTDGVHFQVNFHFWSGDRRLTTAVASVDAEYDGYLTIETVSLDSYAGKTGQFTLYAGAGPSSSKDWAVWATAEIRPIGVVITTDCPLPDATVGHAYYTQLEAVGGNPPYHWTISDGSLPSILRLNPDTGAITGTPEQAGTWAFRIQASDSTILDGAQVSEPKDCYIQVTEPGVTPTPVPAFDFSLSVAPAELTIDLDPLISGATCTAEVQTDATVSLVSGVAQTVTLSLSGVAPGVSFSSYSCLPRDGLPTFTSQCRFSVYCTGTLPEPGDYDITVTATGGGVTRNQTITLHIVRGLYGDLRMVSVEPVQVVYGAPLIQGKGTAFRVKVNSTFITPIETNFELELPDEYWDTMPPYTPPVMLPSGWEYPEIWGPVTINPGDNEIMLPWVPPGQENALFDPESNPAGIIEESCRAPVGWASCYPDLRVVPRPTSATLGASFGVEVDPRDAISETSEINNRYWGTSRVYATKNFRVYFVIHMSNASENDLLYCQNFSCTTGCCSEPPAASCAGGVCGKRKWDNLGH